MGKGKKKGDKGVTERIVLITAILELIKTLLDILG